MLGRLRRFAGSGPSASDPTDVEIHAGAADVVVDLGGVHAISAVLVAAGRRSGARPAAVQVSTDGVTWSRAFATDEVDGLVTRRLRVVDGEPGGRVSVRVRPGHVEPVMADKYVVTRRADGLGERLKALLHAIRLADLLGVDFRFTWPASLSDNPHHAIGPADELFSPEFIAQHLEDPVPDTAWHPLPQEPAGGVDALQTLVARAYGMRSPHFPLSTYLDPAAVPVVAQGFSPEFARIGWHPDIAAAMEAAASIDLGVDPVGLHLRAGDIIYGKFGRWNRYTEKCMSAPLARGLIERFVREGRQVVVFGQDDGLIDDLCAGPGATVATSLRPAETWSAAATAMFDLCLLGRCSRIISGHSGFATQSAFMNDKIPEYFLDAMPPGELLAATYADMAAHGDRYTPEQRAFAWWLAYYTNRLTLPADEGVDLLRSAIEAHPDNPRHRLHLAALEFRRDDIGAGDDVLRAALAHDLDLGGKALASVDVFSQQMVVGFDFVELFPAVDRAIEAGSTVAALYRSAVRARSRDADGAASDLAVFVTAAADDPALAALVEPATRTLRYLTWKSST